MTTSMPISSVVLSRYAGALIDLAEEAKNVSKIQKDMDAIEAMIAESDELLQVIISPRIGKVQQEGVISDLAAKAKLQDLTKNFIGVLIANRRLNALPGVIKSYKKEVARRSGQVEVRVETAEKMTAAQAKDVQKKISLALGTDAVIESHVVPEIIGGMVVTIGSYMIDDSVRRKLERLNVALKSSSNQNTVNLKEVV
ncbi:MAG: ATP synthase F1 subunit delta [Alphaproteobacteria bacterium]